MAKHLRVVVVLALALAAATPILAQTAVASGTRPHVELLASDRLEGRQAGSQGERLAADYVAAQLARVGARPVPGRPDMFAPFEFTAGSRDGGSQIVVTRGPAAKTFSARDQVQALSFSDDAEVSGPAVFAGYGLVVPGSQNFAYDSYAGLDVKDKIVIVLRYFPEDADQQTRAILARYSDLRYKAMAARQRGARAMLVVTGPRSPNAGETIPMTFDTALAGSGIPAASIGREVLDNLLFPGGQALEEVQKALDTGNPHVTFPALEELNILLKTVVVRERQTSRNIIAYLPATTPIGGVDKPWVALGAHYDHLGRGSGGSSLASAQDRSAVHYGADDNASGTSAVLALAEALAGQPRRRSIVFTLWAAEEIGLVGSAAFVAAPPIPLDQIAAYINFDMVGRMQDNRLIVQATGTSPVWTRLLERVNVAAGFDLTVQADPYLPTDSASFNQAGVVTLNFTTGSHADYHKPSDTADKINYEDLDRLVDMAEALVRLVSDADEAPPFTKVDQPASRGSIAGVRVTTGTIPDYATEVKGLLLGGVTGGGPAERAGLMKGDVIVEIAGQTIANIYDYTYALELLKADQPVKVVYVRNGERRETTLTPVVRR
ncbi:MAG: M28 family peptidase [Acidobacteria bacterium]|nr:M28 family peptidase [Acidobacteriota bacterium]